MSKGSTKGLHKGVEVAKGCADEGKAGRQTGAPSLLGCFPVNEPMV